VKTEVFVSVRGGVVQDVRLGFNAESFPSSTHCYVIDYDRNTHDVVMSIPEYERKHLNNRTWREIERVSASVL
jgi:hypothetical protein